MRPLHAIRRLNEKQMQRFSLTLERYDGSRVKCQFCDEVAAEGILIYDPSEISLPGMDHKTGAYYPLHIRIHGVLLRCEACRDADKGKDGIFYHDKYGKWFKS